MELDHAVIRILAAIERERDNPGGAEPLQSNVRDIRSRAGADADDAAARVFSLPLVEALS